MDLIIGISIFLVTLVLIFYLFSLDVTKTEEEDAAAEIIATLSGNKYFGDGELDSDEIDELVAMSDADDSCAQFKEFFNTNKNICIYVTDKDGNLVKIDSKTALGCGGIKIKGVICGETG